jgi:CelD/BcsL family acetyltransferase involved in cellulose biosynthesis
MREVFAPRGQPPTYPPKAAQLVWKRYRDDRDVRMAAARYTGKTAAILITMIDGDRAWIWAGGGRRQYRSVNPNTLLYWDAICWARERGCHAIDLLGNPDRGIATFKASFGGVETPYTVANRENSRLAAWGRWAHSRATLLAHSLTERRATAEDDGPPGIWPRRP